MPPESSGVEAAPAVAAAKQPGVALHGGAADAAQHSLQVLLVESLEGVQASPVLTTRLRGPHP
eukprot:CAMPEP_0179191758 /NCGR_PEP_ID=MMETSP0796-20121207/95252_1 /TAXON_ID=73915 /ORGANISM="Pyrodinium bahamense, Strain pbaha01" /LENGTH=62 /DNA_ID=CAMNT_0020895993 /DNA_START=300 /DNA_END=484 /DNA_ORIENTATION=+